MEAFEAALRYPDIESKPNNKQAYSKQRKCLSCECVHAGVTRPADNNPIDLVLAQVQ